MRISSSKVVQLLEVPRHLEGKVQPRIVLVNDQDGSEIVLDPEEVGNLLRAVEYFAGHLGITTDRPNSSNVEKVTAEMTWTQFTYVYDVLEAYVAKGPENPDGIVHKNAIRTTKFEFKVRK